MPSAYQAASDLFERDQFASSITVCDDTLLVEPDNLRLRILKTRALMALGKDSAAKRELARCLRRDPRSDVAHLLLGELAIRSGKKDAARALLNRALALSPDNQDARDLLGLVETIQPTVVVEKLPAATVTVGCTLSLNDRTAETKAIAPAFNHEDTHQDNFQDTVETTLSPFEDYASLEIGETTMETRRPRPFASGSQFERPRTGTRIENFGGYLVDIGALTPLQLRAALDYHRAHRIKLGVAAVQLGFVSEPSVEWAAHDFHAARAA